jgi:signal transduction histidine kinase
LKNHQHYRIFLALFLVVAVWGCVVLSRSGPSSLALPITPGDEIGWRLESQLRSAEEIIAASQDGRFFTVSSDLPMSAPAAPGHEYWMRIPLTNPDAEPRDYVLEVEYPWLETARLYEPENGFLTTQRGGASVRPEGNSFSHGRNVFRISLEAHESQTFFLSVKDQYRIRPKVQLWADSQSFLDKSITLDRFVFAYIGLMMGLLITNCCVYFVFRYRDLIYYLFYLFSVALLQGVNFQLHFPLLRWITPADTFITEMTVDYFDFGGLVLLSAGLLILFANEFLLIAQHSKRLFRWCRTLGCLALLSTPVIMFGPGRLLGAYIDEFTALVFLGGHLVALCMGIYAASKKLPQANYFLPALVLLLFVCFRYSWLTFSGQAIPSDLISLWLFASCLELIAFTYALVERFLEVNRQKGAAQREALDEVQKLADLHSQYNSELNKEVQSRTSDLEQANDQKDELMRIIAHDLKSPVDSMIKLTEQLTDSSPDPQHQRLAGQIWSNAANLSELMKNLLEWAQLRALQQDLSLQPYLLHDLFDATISTLNPQAKLKNIHFQVEADDALYAEFDFDCVAIVLRNLSANAIKFSIDGSTILLRAVPEAGVVRVEVHDTGCGIEHERLAAIHLGQHVKSRRGSKGEVGNGIGLQICRTVLSGHGCELDIRSTVGQGTVAAFCLKRWKPAL